METPAKSAHAPLASTHSNGRRMPSKGELLPLWIWLAGATVMGLLAPADPVSELLIVAFGLISLGVGGVAGSNVHRAVRLLMVTTWLIVILVFIGYVIFDAGRQPFPRWAEIYGSAIKMASYAGGSIGVGYWASRRVRHGRQRIMLGFVLGCVVGVILGPIVGLVGIVAGAVVGALLARRSLHVPAEAAGG